MRPIAWGIILFIVGAVGWVLAPLEARTRGAADALGRLASNGAFGLALPSFSSEKFGRVNCCGYHIRCVNVSDVRVRFAARGKCASCIGF